MSSATRAALQQHLQAASRGVEAVMADYTEESVLITHEATHRGRAEIRAFFAEILEGSTRGFLGALEMKRMDVAGEMAFICWQALPWFPFATDTLLFREGKIAYQTFAASPR